MMKACNRHEASICAARDSAARTMAMLRKEAAVERAQIENSAVRAGERATMREPRVQTTSKRGVTNHSMQPLHVPKPEPAGR